MASQRPDFFILGAPKCGTTALAQWLAEHPAVFLSPRKEPHYFNTESMPATRNLAEYEALFASAGPGHRAVGEASTHYLYCPEAVPNILAYNPSARFIVCLRNPVEMAPALHAECQRQGWEDRREFARAWELQPARHAGRELPRAVRADPDRLQYGAYCRLGEQLQRLYRWVPQERVLALLLDDLRADPAGVYRRTLAFLQVDDDGRRQFPVVNATPPTRSLLLSRLIRHTSRARDALGISGDWGIAAALRRLNSAGDRRPALSPEMAGRLRRYFADDVTLLSQLLGRDLSHWIAPDSDGDPSSGTASAS
ncbi:sulfotransferase domain-containing protein [Arhodomonas sp. SL1]|uniref:sulfotransferase domain-containing protein n=1 Tax=Arhodomonas sp. SL1 TaxID=3425691 RepID=UPI003F885697